MQLINTLLWVYIMLITSFNTSMVMNIRPTSTNIELAQSRITANPPIGCPQFLQKYKAKRDHLLNKEFCSFNPNFKKYECNSHSISINQNKDINRNGFLLYTLKNLTMNIEYNNFNSLIDEKDKETSLNNIEKYANETLTELESMKTDLETGFETFKEKYTNITQITDCITLKSQKQESIPETYITQIVNPMKKLYLYRKQEIQNIKIIIDKFNISDFTKDYTRNKWDNFTTKIKNAIQKFMDSNHYYYYVGNEYNILKTDDQCIDNRFLKKASKKLDKNIYDLFRFYHGLSDKKNILYDNTIGILTSDSFKLFKQAHYEFLNSYTFYLHSCVCFVESTLLAHSKNSEGMKSLFSEVEKVIKNDINYLNNSIGMLDYILELVKIHKLQEQQPALSPLQESSLASDASSIMPVGFISALLSIAIVHMNNRHV